MRVSEQSGILSVQTALQWGAAQLAGAQSPMLDARVLLKAALNLDDAKIIADSARLLTEAETATYSAMIARRSRNEPVAHITGFREFWSLPIAVAPGALVPRADSETLIAAAIARRERRGPIRILDLGCGSGALLCALLEEFRDACGFGVDVDPRAAALTSRNIDRLGFSARAYAVAGDWTAPLRSRFDIVISNPPYIAEAERGKLPPEVEAFEDPRALFAGTDGLNAYRRLAGLLPAVLKQDGLLLLEIGFDQASAVEAIVGAAFPKGRPVIAKDFGGRDRALIIDLRVEAR
jgi:release factor glutamine methyltransferase